MQLHFEGVVKGKYQVQLINEAGQMVLAKIVDVNDNQVINIPLHKLASGNYTLNVMNLEGIKRTNQQIFVE